VACRSTRVSVPLRTSSTFSVSARTNRSLPPNSAWRRFGRSLDRFPVRQDRPRVDRRFGLFSRCRASVRSRRSSPARDRSDRSRRGTAGTRLGAVTFEPRSQRLRRFTLGCRKIGVHVGWWRSGGVPISLP
jgi:hypothetical protein